MKNLCPFLKENCNTNCVFHTHNIATPDGITNCLIVSKLNSINDYEYEQLNDISNFLDLKKK